MIKRADHKSHFVNRLKINKRKKACGKKNEKIGRFGKHKAGGGAHIKKQQLIAKFIFCVPVIKKVTFPPPFSIKKVTFPLVLVLKKLPFPPTKLLIFK
jgi:hypothetical protein